MGSMLPKVDGIFSKVVDEWSCNQDDGHLHIGELSIYCRPALIALGLHDIIDM